METDAIERGTYEEGRTYIDNKDEDRPGRNAWLSSWSMGTALILSARAQTDKILEE